MKETSKEITKSVASVGGRTAVEVEKSTRRHKNTETKKSTQRDNAKYKHLPKRDRRMLTFSERLEDSTDELKGWYNGVIGEIFKYKKIHSRVSERYNTIKLGRTPLMRISIRKKTVRVYFNLTQAGYPKNYRLKDSSDKKAFENFPTLLNIISNRSYGYALTLIDELADNFELDLL